MLAVAVDHLVKQTSRVKIEMNSSDEVFITNIKGITIRITPNQNDIVVTTQTTGAILLPTSINGLSAFRVERR